MTRYVTRIREAWDTITKGRERLRKILDAKTVDVLQGRCPKYRGDRDLIRSQWKDVFSCLDGSRQSIWTGIAEIDYIIPSIHTFLEDTKLLEPCARIMKTLLPSACKTTILQEFEWMHNKKKKSWSLQTAETTFMTQTEASSDDAHRNAYRQLWLYGMRHFPEMTGQPLRKDPGKPKPPRPAIELIWWYGFTRLALDCGYTGIDRTYANNDEADYKMVEAFLQQVRPHQLYTGSMQNELQQMVGLLKTLRRQDQEMEDLGHLEDEVGVNCGPDIAFRCGVPFHTPFREDQPALFLAQIDRVPQNHQEYIRSFAVKRDIFHSFFGAPEGPSNPRSRNLPEPRPSPTVDALQSPDGDPSQLQAPSLALPPASDGPSRNRSSPPSPELPLAETQHHFNEMDQFSSSRPPDLSLFEEDAIIMRDQTDQMLLDHQLDSVITRDEAVQMLLDHQRDSTTLLILEEVSKDRFRFYDIMYTEIKDKLPRLEKDLQYLTVEPLTENLHFQNVEGHRKRRKTRQVKVVEPFSVHAQSVILVARRDSKMARVIYGKMQRLVPKAPSGAITQREKSDLDELCD